jgi:hypothetical protein
LRSETEAALARARVRLALHHRRREPFWGHDRLEQVERWATGGW